MPFPAERPRVRLALAPTEQAPALARRAVAGLADDLAGDEVFTTQLLLTELISNVVEHANEMSPRRATATIWISQKRIRADVLDFGQGFRPRLTMPTPESESGWGLHLVDQIADEWGVVPGEGSWVWFELVRLPSPALAPDQLLRATV